MKSKAQELAESLFRLKQDLSVYEVIAANSDRLRDCEYNKFLSYVYWRSQSSIIVRLCSIYETQIEKDKAYSLSSISGIRKSIINGDLEISELILTEFLKLYPCDDPTIIDRTKQFLHSTKQFGFQNKQVIKELKKYRDTQLAHHETGIEIKSLPSFAEMDSLYKFAYLFCKVVVSTEGLLRFTDDRILMDTKKTLGKLIDADFMELESILK